MYVCTYHLYMCIIVYPLPLSYTRNGDVNSDRLLASVLCCHWGTVCRHSDPHLAICLYVLSIQCMYTGNYYIFPSLQSVLSGPP